MLVPTISSRYEAFIELTRESVILETRLKPITAELNAFPLRVNKKSWQRNLDAAEENANLLTEYCRYLTKDNRFRPNAPADCLRALHAYDPKSNVTKTDKDTLSELATAGDLLAGTIIDARSAMAHHSQLKAWRVFAEDGHVHSFWDPVGTPHGRYTSESPCLNNRINAIRETVEPDEGFSFLSTDLGQAEYVTWASLSGDPVLSQAFREKRDFHLEMAAMVRTAVPEWFPNEDLRQAGKTLNFAILYQMKPHTLARKLGCAADTATKIIKAYYDRVPRASLYIQDVLTRADYLGYVETHYGRRRYCPEYQTAKGHRESHEIEKTLWNHVNAGTAAEFTKWKQVFVWEELRRAGFSDNHVRLAIQMFDECIWQVRDDVMDEVRSVTEEIWLRPEEGFLPFQATIQTGKTWEAASK